MMLLRRINCMNKSDVKNYLDSFEFDIRKTGFNRCLDQKCTYDVVCFVADCIVNFVEDNITMEFTTSEIWHSDFAWQNAMDIFNKPDPSKPGSKREYDK